MSLVVCTAEAVNTVFSHRCTTRRSSSRAGRGVLSSPHVLAYSMWCHRFLMGLVFELFRGRVSPEQLAAVIEEYKRNEYVNYDLYGHFYLGLYYDALGYAEECVRHMGLATQAAKAKSTDLMYHFPRMHLVLKEKKWQA